MQVSGGLGTEPRIGQQRPQEADTQRDQYADDVRQYAAHEQVGELVHGGRFQVEDLLDLVNRQDQL
ncbi:hypothetical protein [Streptomyces sp. G45]|uniref:hypothetical protein n=1 Tax=Streptomyces sp. G45 TaxID=3406627 RepID=UPI003C165D4A